MLPVEHRVDADGQAVLERELAHHLERTRADARIVHVGDPDGDEVSHRREQRCLDLLVVERRLLLVDQRRGIVDQDAAGAAVGVALDLAAGRIARLRADAGDLQRLGIHPFRMAVDALEHHRMIRHPLGEELLVGELRAGPTVLVPAAAPDPAALGRRPGALDDAVHALRLAAEAEAAHVQERTAVAGDVAVRVGEPGDGTPSAEIDDLRGDGVARAGLA